MRWLRYPAAIPTDLIAYKYTIVKYVPIHPQLVLGRK